MSLPEIIYEDRKTLPVFYVIQYSELYLNDNRTIGHYRRKTRCGRKYQHVL